MSPAVLPSPVPLSGSLLVIETSSTAGFASHASKTSTSILMSCSLWFGGQRTDGFGEAEIIGGVESLTVTNAVSDAGACACVAGSVNVTVNVTSVVPTGKTPIGVRLVGSLKVTPGAVHRELKSGPMLEPLPVRLICVPPGGA